MGCNVDPTKAGVSLFSRSVYITVNSFTLFSQVSGSQNVKSPCSPAPLSIVFEALARPDSFVNHNLSSLLYLQFRACLVKFYVSDKEQKRTLLINAQFLSSNFLKGISRVSIEHVKKRLLTECLCLVGSRCRCIYIVALRQVKIWFDTMRGRRICPGCNKR